jgi:hypothetical protein
MEILLVSTLIVIVAATAMPSLKVTLANQRLKKAAETIRAEWTRARAAAMKTGQTQVFRHLVNQPGYLTMPQVSPEDLVESDQLTLARTFAGDAFLGGGDLGMTTALSELPAGVVFVGADVALDQRTAMQMVSYEQDPSVAGFGTAGAASQTQWGMPVYFFPDGTTSTARLVLANQTGLALAVELRGLTGIARVTPISGAALSGIPGAM